MSWQVIQGDCIEQMAELEEASVDAVVCDPPAGISFMNKSWDGNKGGRDAWVEWLSEVMAEALRVCKPGAHALVWALPRTSHWTAWALEEAGWEVRDRIAHHFGSGFPKNHDISKAIDKAAGVEREVVGPNPNFRPNKDAHAKAIIRPMSEGEAEVRTAPATPEAAQWEGWGTALKPSTEDWWLCRKPLIGTVSENVLEHGTGGINVDACRIEHQTVNGGNLADNPHLRESIKNTGSTFGADGELEQNPQGRWPGNAVLSHLEECEPVGVRVLKGDRREGGNGRRAGGFADVGADNGAGEPNAAVYGDETITEWDCPPGCPAAELDAQSGDRPGMPITTKRKGESRKGYGLGVMPDPTSGGYGDSGGASRFFYCAKTSRAERNAGLEGFEEKASAKLEGGAIRSSVGRDVEGTTTNLDRRAANNHPTVKPINLMRWLVRLVTPPGGTCLDPFLGSGSTGCAAVLEGFNFIGIEREEGYVAISEARIAFWAQHEGRDVEDVLGLVARSQRDSKAHEESGQLGLEAVQT